MGPVRQPNCSSTNTYGWPDANGDILKCVSNVWTLVTQPATAAGSSGYLQFNSSGVLGASSNLFWDNANFRLGIGSSAPVVSLDLSQKTDALALPVGTQGQEPASPMNGMIRYSTTANDVEAYIGGAWTTLTTGGSNASITLGTSAATPNPASSYSATTGLFSGASGQVSVASTGNEIARFTGTGVSIGTTYVSTAAPANGLIVQGNVGIGTANPSAQFTVSNGGTSTNGVVTISPFGAGNNRTMTIAGSTLNVTATSNASVQPMGIQTNGGSVGIGTSGPDALLSLSGQSAQTIDMVREMTASTAGNNLTLQAGGATPLGTDKAGGTLALSSGISTGTGSSGINFNIYKAAGSSGSADNAATTAMTVTGAGSVGLGTTAPTTLLDVYGGQGQFGSASGTRIGVNGSVGEVLGIGNSQSAYNALQFRTGTNPAIYLDTSGNVGIGTTVPATLLNIYGDNEALRIGTGANNSSYIGFGYYSAGSTDRAQVGYSSTSYGSDTGYAYLEGGAANKGVALVAGSPSTPFLYVTQYGNVGIGTTAPAYLLHVGSPTAVGVVADFQNSSGYCTFSPSANGILTTCTSDVRLKKDIVDAGDALAWLGTMRIRDFTLRATGERRTGVIAQEMMKVHPEMVRMGSTGFYQVDVPDAWKLIKAIQELKAENDDLVNRIGAEDNALKAANTTSPTCARRSKRTKLSIREQRSKRHRFAIKSVAL